MGNKCFSTTEVDGESQPDRESAQTRALLSEDGDQEEEFVGSLVNQAAVKLTHMAAAESAQKRHESLRHRLVLEYQITSEEGRRVQEIIRKAYDLRNSYQHPTLDFSMRVSQLFSTCEAHIASLAEEGSPDSQLEADAVVDELLRLREHWGTDLLPLNMKNAFFRERISLSGGDPPRMFRLDCIQFFEPLLFYSNEVGPPHELVKLYVFLLTEIEKASPFMTLYLERTCHSGEFYHCLCFFCEGNVRGQFKIYGDQCPTYWELREDVLDNAKQTVQHIVSEGLDPLPDTICVTVLTAPRPHGPINM